MDDLHCLVIIVILTHARHIRNNVRANVTRVIKENPEEIGICTEVFFHFGLRTFNCSFLESRDQNFLHTIQHCLCNRKETQSLQKNEKIRVIRRKKNELPR